MKKILGLDLGTNSIGWALAQNNIENKKGDIIAAGSRIIPMTLDKKNEFNSGQSISQTADRTHYRGVRRNYQRNRLRRDRLHRVLHIMGYLPNHYAQNIDFEHRLGQFKEETKLSYVKTAEGYKFLFIDSFEEMCQDFKAVGHSGPIPHDWTIYYLRKKALAAKISKQELAWIILNFNQKRGYYQLRGEDGDNPDNKAFVVLKVKELIDTGEEVKGNKLYDVTFENGWHYHRQITNTENWQGRTKEFIVTTKQLASGEIKRTYKAVDSENDWPAIKAKTEQDIIQSGKSVGQYIFDILLKKPTQKIRGKLIKTIERQFYKQELIDILAHQAQYHNELTSSESFTSCLEHLYPKNKAHRQNIGDKNLQYLITEDIIFYQRPLKSKKSTISGCNYESKTYTVENEDGTTKDVTKPIQAISKSHPLYQEFRLWQLVQNIRIYDTTSYDYAKKPSKADVTLILLPNEKATVDLYDYLNDRADVEEKHIIDYFVKKKIISKEDKKSGRYKWNYVSDKKYPCNSTRTDILKRLAKVERVDPSNFLTRERELVLWHIIYSVKDKKQFRKTLKNYANKNGISEDSFVAAFEKMPPYTNDYGTLSQKAINKLLPLMRMGKYWQLDDIDANTRERINKIITGEYDANIRTRVRDKAINLQSLEDFKGLPLWLASYIVYDRHSEIADITRWTKPSDIDTYLSRFKQHSLRNPIVEKVVLETLRVVRDIWTTYGNSQPNYFDGIHIELGREMKNSADKRKSMTNRIRENENTNTRIRQLLGELMNDSNIQADIRPHSPSHQELLKIYEEGIAQNPNADYSVVSEDEILKIRKKNKPTGSDITRYKLWLEQGYISPYTGAIIPLSKLFTRDYEIEHIIPRARFFDDSLSNKIICETAVNADKDKRTAYEYLLKKGGEIVDGHELLTPEEYEHHCHKYFKKNKTKLQKLLSEDIPEDFVARQMNDSRYIAKYIKGLLSNIVREENEQEATSKRLLPVSGAITSKLKRDWGLNDKWNELIAPRFQRLNELTKSNDFGFYDPKIKAFRTAVPDELRAGFNKKRIDHRHHTLDAIVLAFCTREHVNYLNSLNSNRENFALRKRLLKTNKQGDLTRYFQEPFLGFAPKVLQVLERTIVSFKQNNRVINRTKNKTWQWVEENGQLKKKLLPQTKGDSWAIRKSLHKETVSGKICHPEAKGKRIATANRVSLSDITDQKQINKISASSIRNILNRHLKNYLDQEGNPQFDQAFSQAGIEDLNRNIIVLNSGKPHMPIYKVRQFEVGLKFPVGALGNNPQKYVEAAKGTNLFFAIYWNKRTEKREYSTVPLNEVITHQKQVAHLSQDQRTPIQPDPSNGQFLFTLSPNDLVFVPSDEEIDNPSAVNFDNLTIEQTKRIYKMVSTSQNQCHFIPYNNATEIKKNENGTNSKNERIQIEILTIPILDDKGKGIMIKQRCWKVVVNRLGMITSANKGEVQ